MFPNNPYRGYWRDKYLIDSRVGKCTKQVIIKHSKNLIDLIEVGDYVNGSRVDELYDGYVFVENSDCRVKEIETIVTKEQFKSMEYKV